MAVASFAAVDLGAESGRVVRGRVGDGRLAVEEVLRFPNQPLRLAGGLHWDLARMLEHSLDGLAAAAARGPLTSVGIDAWGVDYALLDDADGVVGAPFHYRDERTAGMIERATRRLPADRLYAATGIQQMPINTVYQLLADEHSGALARAARIALMPDLLGLWLCGELRNELTTASTTGLLDAHEASWAHDAIADLRLPAHLFDDGALVLPGTPIGRLLAEHAARCGVTGELPVVAVAGHDTASAFVAAPIEEPETTAILSSGTWSLIGLELDAPALGEHARAANLTNERGVDGTTRLLKNVMGLWLVQECRRSWARQGDHQDYASLERLAWSERGDVGLFDPDHPLLLAPGSMPSRIAAACEHAGEPIPVAKGAVIRSTLLSLACKYRLVLESLEQASGRSIERIHVVGGGARNRLLCQLTATVCGRPVHAGPAEATAIGNVLVQARAAGLVGSLAEGRALVAGAHPAIVFSPDTSIDGEAIVERFRAAAATAIPTGAA
jgi:rhamnulokinase